MTSGNYAENKLPVTSREDMLYQPYATITYSATAPRSTSMTYRDLVSGSYQNIIVTSHDFPIVQVTLLFITLVISRFILHFDQDPIV